MRLNGFNGWLNGLLIASFVLLTGISYNSAVAWQKHNQSHNPSDSPFPNQSVVKAESPTKNQVSHPLRSKAAVTQQTLRFIAIGDTGSRLPGQYKTAAALARHYQQHPFEFVVMLGDNIYPHGDVQKYGKPAFLEPYAPLLKENVPFYVCLGNHDVLFGHKAAQMAFFKMPGSYYALKKGLVDFFAIDTNDFDKTQQQWLTRELKKSRAPWKIVFGHHPVYSSGKHGGSLALQQTLDPILKAYQVDLYLAGHEHEYERFEPIGGVTHVVSGGGGAALRQFGSPAAHSKVREVSHNFVRLEANADHITAVVLNPELQTLDQFVLTSSKVKTSAVDKSKKS